MQPTRFLVIRDDQVRRRVHQLFYEANLDAALGYTADRKDLYKSLKLEGILEAPQNVCVLCEQDSAQGHGLGRQTMPEAAIYSTVCAVQNLWLAARVEGVGVGWVSILDMPRLRTLLNVPDHLVIVAYLCVGYVAQFGAGPELERAGWEIRRSVDECIAIDCCPEAWQVPGTATSV